VRSGSLIRSSSLRDGNGMWMLAGDVEALASLPSLDGRCVSVDCESVLLLRV
jgi:hypothetical protein